MRQNAGDRRQELGVILATRQLIDIVSFVSAVHSLCSLW